MEALKISDSVLRITRQTTAFVDYNYTDLIRQREAITKQRDAELAEVNELIAEFEKRYMNVMAGGKVIYSTETSKVYVVDEIGFENEDPTLVELQAVPNPMPPYDPDNQTVEQTWKVDLAAGQYLQCWEVYTLSEADKARMSWIHPDYRLRIVAPLALALTDIGAKIYTWFSINGLPVEKSGNEVHLYCNEVLPDHTAILTEMGLQPETTPFAAYLFNTASGEIHNLNTVTQFCNIDQIITGVPMLEADALVMIAEGKADGCAHCLPAYNQTTGTKG